MRRARRATSKAGRNEQRKLIATALNNAGVAFALAAVLQPALAYVQQNRRFDLASSEAAAMFLAAAFVLFVIARAIAGRLED